MCLTLRPWNEDPTCVHFTSVSELGTRKKKSMDQGTSGLARQRLMAKRGSWDFYSHHLAFSVQDHRLLLGPLGPATWSVYQLGSNQDNRNPFRCLQEGKIIQGNDYSTDKGTETQKRAER